MINNQREPLLCWCLHEKKEHTLASALFIVPGQFLQADHRLTEMRGCNTCPPYSCYNFAEITSQQANIMLKDYFEHLDLIRDHKWNLLLHPPQKPQQSLWNKIKGWFQ